MTLIISQEVNFPRSSLVELLVFTPPCPFDQRTPSLSMANGFKSKSQEVKPARKSESHQVRFNHPKLPHCTKSSLWALSPRIETGLMLRSY